MTGRSGLLVVLTGVTILLVVFFVQPPRDSEPWTDAELKMLASLRLGNFEPPPPSPSNAVADDAGAAALGEKIFFDPDFSLNGQIACATCHQPERAFTDGLAVSVGLSVTSRNSMTLIGAAYSPWYFWDGRKDSLWSQALAPLESREEQGSNRMAIAHRISSDPEYRGLYLEVFDTLPDFSDPDRFPASAAPGAGPVLNDAWQSMTAEDRERVDRVFSNIGKSLAAYQRRLVPQATRFDHYVEALLDGNSTENLMSPMEIAGLRLFIGQGQCVTCHNGPLLTNNGFHNTGSLPSPGKLPSKGRSVAVGMVAADPFNCLGEFSDAAGHCPELRFMSTGDELIGAHRTPTLRNVANTAPYMHAGQVETLAAVLAQYNQAPAALVGHNEAKPLGLSARELENLEAFLVSLNDL